MINDTTRVAEAVAAAARRYDTQPALVRDVVVQYVKVADVYKTASIVGLPWPKVHLIVTDLRRAGVLPRRLRRRAA